MRRRLCSILVMVWVFSFAACQAPDVQEKEGVETGRVDKQGWQQKLGAELPLLGHRNWILVVDKAYPAPNNPDILVINTGAQMIDVLRNMDSIFQEQPHIKPIIYQDSELQYLDEDLVKGITDYKKEVQSLWRNYMVQEIAHEAIFKKIDEASKLFKVIVLKTESLQPYTSVFMEIDCGYWDAKREEILRARIQ